MNYLAGAGIAFGAFNQSAMRVYPENFRAALGRWASGVTVVTARFKQGAHGMTASSLVSVSLSPALISVCMAKDARTLEWMTASQAFAVNVLSSEQESLSRHFSSAETDRDRLKDVAFGELSTGSPVLDGAAVVLDCRMHAMHPAGDHVLCIGEVVQTRVSDKAPLLFYRGEYRRLDPKV